MIRHILLIGGVCCLGGGILSPLLSSSSLFAQQPITGNLGTTPRTIFEALASSKPGEGKVVIFQPEEVRLRIGGVNSASESILRGEGNIQIGIGYRIQAYTGNMSNSKAEAYSRATQIGRKHPDLPCYITYKAPFWKLNVGDFSSQEDARKVVNMLKRDFPGLARELYVVRDRIRSAINP